MSFHRDASRLASAYLLLWSVVYEATDRPIRLPASPSLTPELKDFFRESRFYASAREDRDPVARALEPIDLLVHGSRALDEIADEDRALLLDSLQQTRALLDLLLKRERRPRSIEAIADNLASRFETAALGYATRIYDSLTEVNDLLQR